MRLTTDRLDDTKRALKVQKQKGVRLRKKVKDDNKEGPASDATITHCKLSSSHCRMSANCSEVLQATFSGVPSELMQRMLRVRFLNLIT